MKRSQKICLSAAFARVIFWQCNEVNFSQFLNRLDFFGSFCVKTKRTYKVQSFLKCLINFEKDNKSKTFG
jgi:hypothetical protein